MQCTPSSPVTGNEIIATATATAATSLSFFALPLSNQFHRSDDESEQSLSRPTARRGRGPGVGAAGPPRPLPSPSSLFPNLARIHHWSNAGGVASSVGFLAPSAVIIFGKLFDDAKDGSKNRKVRIAAADGRGGPTSSE